jgi:hypothetical protein
LNISLPRPFAINIINAKVDATAIFASDKPSQHKGKSIADVLDMTVDQAVEFFDDRFDQSIGGVSTKPFAICNLVRIWFKISGMYRQRDLIAAPNKFQLLPS